MRSVGISPKVVAATITGIVVYLITKLGLRVDPVIEQAINVAATLLAAYLAPPGAVKEDEVASDDLLPGKAKTQLKES